MDSSDAPRRSISLVGHKEDYGLVTRGSLIPLSVQRKQQAALAHRPERSLLVVLATLVLVVCGVGIAYAPLLTQLSFTDIPLVATIAASDERPLLVVDPFSGRALPPEYGASQRYSDTAVYEAARESLVGAQASFVDINTAEQRVRLFKGGVLEYDVPILKTPGSDSWCAVSAGLYQVEALADDHYSSYLDAYLPFSIIWNGNRFLHGWPSASDFGAVESNYDRDCLRLETTDAKHIFEAATVGMPILVHTAPPAKPAQAAYESKVPAFSTPYYLIADASDETVLAVGDKHASVPIASLTKLMTALIVLDTLSLDKRVAIEEPLLIESLVPRLHERSRVSVHTLLTLLLTESSNEAAEVLASAVGREHFIALMNERAAALGLVDTVFTDPAGLEPGNVSSVYDLWLLTRYLYTHYPFIIALTRNDAAVPSGVTDTYSELSNFNEIESVDSFIGGKVGETEAAGQTSVTLHRLTISGAERIIVIVLLGSEGRNDDVKALLSYLETRFND